MEADGQNIKVGVYFIQFCPKKSFSGASYISHGALGRMLDNF
jgi:hypothetical protein